MPLLLDKGIVSSSAECRGFTLGVLVKIIKTSRAALKDWLVRLIAVLVESMSALEPKMFQVCIHFSLDKHRFFMHLSFMSFYTPEIKLLMRLLKFISYQFIHFILLCIGFIKLTVHAVSHNPFTNLR